MPILDIRPVRSLCPFCPFHSEQEQLQKMAHDRVKKWTKNVNIFEKARKLCCALRAHLPSASLSLFS